MRYAVLCCAVLSCATGIGPWSSMSSAQSLNQVIAPENRSHDFGVVARAANTEHRFVFTNPFKTDLHISSVRTSCNCTTPSIETQIIRPGEEGAVLARFNTGSFTGQRAATITVTINRPMFTELQLNIKGYIRSDIVFTPGEAAFGAVPEGTPATRELTLNYAGRQDWQITDITSPTGFISATFTETERGGGRVSYKVNVQLQENAPAGFFQNQLVLHTNDRRLTTVPLRVTAEVEPALQSAPAQVALGTVKPGEPVTQRLVLKGREAFTISEITCEQAEIRVELDDTPKRAYILNLVIAAKDLPPNVAAANPNAVQAEIVIQTTLQPAPLRIPLTFVLERQGGQGAAEVALNTIE